MAWQILGRLALTFVLIASGLAWEAPPVFLSALVIFGSAVHLIFRSSRGELATPGRPRQLEARVDERIQEIEDRQDAELEYLEERTDSRFAETVRRLADLEERLEAAEHQLSGQSLTDSLPGSRVIGIHTPI